MLPLQDELRMVMTLRGGSLGELARESGVSRPTVSRVYNDKMKPSLAATEALARAMGMKLALVRLGQKNQAPCGHKFKLPDPGDYRVFCKECERMYEWTMVEVE